MPTEADVLDAPAPCLTDKDFKSDFKPLWCPGCGDFSVLAATAKAFAALGMAHEDIAVITGIGCSGRYGSHINVYGFHGVHGRALAVGTGLKITRPDLVVLVVGGDGDGFAIGGNHFLHACRRNVDLTYLVMDNQVYGMTKGQASPTTEADWTGSNLTPHGPGAAPFHALPVALATGANFIARGFTGDPKGLAQMIVEAVRHPGFSFVDILSPCVTYQPEQKDWKRRVRPGFAEPTTDAAEAQRRLMDDDGFNVGILFKGDRPPFRPAGPASAAGDLARIRGEFALEA